MHYYIYLTTFVTLIQLVIGDFKCGPNGQDCKCYQPTNDTANTSQVVCSGAITSADLYTYGNSISGQGNLLYIRDTTNLDIIKEDSFSKATFKRIFIERNEKLRAIEEKVFQMSARTVTLAVRENPLLEKSYIFENAARVGDGLTDVEFQQNHIESFENAFNDNIFKKLSDIRLDSQKLPRSTEIRLTKQSFAKLPSLTHLSLNNNKYNIVGDKKTPVIDLTATTSARVSIFLQESELQTLDGLLANSTKTIGLVLEGNPLKEVPVICYEIATHSGTCFLKDTNTQNTIICDCVKQYWVTKLLATPAYQNNIQGLTELVCSGKKITECEEPPKTPPVKYF